MTESARVPQGRWLQTVMLLALLALSSAIAAPAKRPPGSTHRLGERMYRSGILPSGQPMPSMVLGDAPLQGNVFACGSCHLRSGTGSYEGGVVTLPIHGAALFRPYFRNLRNLSPEEQAKRLLITPPNRPAYTDQSLATAIRSGMDPTGREFGPVMPRYPLGARDMAILIDYLKTLSAEYSPGVDPSTLRLATVITEEVTEHDRQAMLTPLLAYVDFHNQLSQSFDHWMYYSRSGQDMIRQYRRLSLSQWLLKGPPATWPRQLADYYRSEPVFALVGGISYGDWQPIHAFCERQGLPCILPITDFPVVSATDWYTLYFSKGYFQEGEAAARHLDQLLEQPFPGKIASVVLATAESLRLAEGFRTTWRELGRPPVREFPLEKPVAGTLRNLIQVHKPQVLLLWGGPQVFEELQDIGSGPDRPELVFMSSGYLKDKAVELPDSARTVTFLTYPYRFPEEEVNYLRNTNIFLKEAGNPARIATRIHSMIQVLNKGLAEMQRDLYRDNLLDRISMLPDQVLADYERLSFGPGQRYASKGCYIVQFTAGAAPSLVKRSGWVVQ